MRKRSYRPLRLGGSWQLCAKNHKSRFAQRHHDPRWAPEYVEAMWMMLQKDTPEDFVIATGESHSLQEFVETVFSCAGVEWRDHVETDSALLRPADISIGGANPARAREGLGWQAGYKMRDVARMMVEAEREEQKAKGEEQGAPRA